MYRNNVLLNQLKIIFEELLIKRNVGAFSDYYDLSGGYAFKSSEYKPEGNFILRVTNINPDGTIDKKGAKYISEENSKNHKDYSLTEGDTLIVMIGGSIGKIGFIDEFVLPAFLNQNMWLVRSKDSISSRYSFFLCLFLCHFYATEKKTSYSFYSRNKFRNLLIPSITPKESYVLANLLDSISSENYIEECSLISNNTLRKINLLTQTKCNQNKLITELSHQQTLIKKLRQQILQEAIEGKLTKDWRADNSNIEPASELLKRIQAEKAQLIKDKKIKKQKPLPPISEEEKPFELPDGWVWCRLGEILDDLLGGYSFKAPLFKKTGTKQVLRLGNIRPYIVRLDANPVFIDKQVAIEGGNAKLKQGDLLITMTGTRGKRDYCYTVLLNETHFQEKELYLNQRVGCLRFNQHIFLRCYDYCLKSEVLLNQIFSTATGAAQQANIGSTTLKSWVVPLPPLLEQKAIVSKVEKLLALCDQLESQITRNQNHAEQLMQAVLKEAFSQDTTQTEVVAVNTQKTKPKGSVSLDFV